jgi:hypothetical protein
MLPVDRVAVAARHKSVLGYRYQQWQVGQLACSPKLKHCDRASICSEPAGFAKTHQTIEDFVHLGVDTGFIRNAQHQRAMINYSRDRHIPQRWAMRLLRNPSSALHEANEGAEKGEAAIAPKSD